MRDPNTGQRVQMDVGTETINSAYTGLIFRKPTLRSELVVEAIEPNNGGRKVRGIYGREGDGSWRGKVEDLGHASQNSPYTFIRVLDDEQINLRDAQEMLGQQADSYDGQVERDQNEWDEANLYDRLNERLQELQGNTQELKKDFEAGMRLFFGDNWETVALELFPQGKPW